MLLIKNDFEKIKQTITQKFLTFQTEDRFEEYLKGEFEKSPKIFVENILRAENILLNMDRENNIKKYSFVKLVLKANITKNKDILLNHKDENIVKKYIGEINKRKLEHLEKLENIFKILEPSFSDILNLNDIQNIEWVCKKSNISKDNLRKILLDDKYFLNEICKEDNSATN